MAHLNLCSKSMIRMACDPRSESPCSVLRLLSKVMVATVLQGKVLYYCLLKKKMFVLVCLYIYFYFFNKYLQFSPLVELFQTRMKGREEAPY